MRLTVDKTHTYSTHGDDERNQINVNTLLNSILYLNVNIQDNNPMCFY